MLLRISFVVGVMCIWCVIGENMTMTKVMSDHLTKNHTKPFQSNIDSKMDFGKDDEKSRSARQLDPGAWTPFSPIPAVWSPRPRSLLNTWWASPWPFDAGSALVRVRPPGAFIPPPPPEEVLEHQHHKHEHHKFEHYKHDHDHHHHHHTPFYHDNHHHEDHHHHHEDYHHHHHKPAPLLPFPPGPHGTYIAQNLGAVHIAPMPGHIGNVIASNMQPPAGTVPLGPFGPGPSLSIDGPAPPGFGFPPPPRPVPPPPAALPFARTW